MVDFSSNAQHVGLDIGCGSGCLSEFLAQKLVGTVVGIDVFNPDLKWAKSRIKILSQTKKIRSNVEFVNSDIAYLPFRPGCTNLIVCMSVLEHMEDLDKAVGELRSLVAKDGTLIAGYPIERGLFIALVKMLRSDFMKIRDPRIFGVEEFRKNPETHKQTTKTIRAVLQKHFMVEEKQKSFSSMLPDLLSWYEIVKMRRPEKMIESNLGKGHFLRTIRNMKTLVRKTSSQFKSPK